MDIPEETHTEGELKMNRDGRKKWNLFILENKTADVLWGADGSAQKIYATSKRGWYENGLYALLPLNLNILYVSVSGNGMFKIG